MVAFLSILCVCMLCICIGVSLSFSRRERRLLGRLQDMLDRAAAGTFEDNDLSESKISMLENSMWRYICDHRLAYQELMEQNEHMQQLVSDLSHQAVTPVSNIVLYSQLLEEALAAAESDEGSREARSGSKSEEIRAEVRSGAISDQNRDEMIQGICAILDQAGKVDFFIRLLVKLSRLEKDIITVKPKEQGIGTVLQALKQQFVLKAEEKSVEFEVEDSQETAVFDRKWTIEAAANLVDNAIKYTPGGGKVSVCVVPYSMFLRLDVKDTGIGIREEDQGKIFTRFYRAGTVQGEAGTGIGLYIARKVMKMQDGYMKVVSQEGKGSTFSLFFKKISPSSSPFGVRESKM